MNNYGNILKSNQQGVIMKNSMLYTILIVLASSCAFAQTFEQKAHMLSAMVQQPFSSAGLEKQLGEELQKVQNIVKDEFETQAEFEKRRSESSAKSATLRAEYTRRIAEAKKVYDKRQQEIKGEFKSLLAQSLENVESSIAIGTYEPESNTFPVTTTTSGQTISAKVPRELARDFKAQSSSLRAKGQKQMNENLQWEYFNWSVSLTTGQTFVLGEQRGVGAQVAQLQSTPPPSLTAKVTFSEPSGNNALDAEEKGKLTLTVTNNGKGSALGVEARVTSENALGITAGSSLFVGEVPAGESRSAALELSANDQVQNAKSPFTFTFTEARGFPPDPIKVTIETRALVPSKFIIADVGVREPSGNGSIENEEVVEITARIQNVGQGTAKNVKASFDLGQNVFKAQESATQFTIGDLAAGAYYDALIRVYTNKVATEVPVFITVTEPSGRYDVKRLRLDPAKLALNVRVQQLQEVVIAGKERSNTSIEIAGGLSIDIEQNIPKTSQRNPNAIAAIIGIREYQSSDIPKVEYAKRDAQIMRDYLVKVLGYDPKNILPQNPDELMTVGNMKSLLRQKLSSYLKPDGSSDLFIYYAGHGAPSTTSQEPFFVPYDCDPNFVSDDNAYKMSDFYADIAKVNAKKKTVVIDACFSGQSGDGKAIVKNASPVLLKVKNALFASKDAIVFQSSESNQVSNWYPEKKHGMFTYFFLKGLKGDADLNKDGTITVGEMESYINDENNNLPYVSQREMQRKQRAVVSGEKTMTMSSAK